MSNAKNLQPHLEIDLLNRGVNPVIGIDEAGRGPLAGPVVASAVILLSYEFQHPIADSKKLSSLQRESAFHEITQKAVIGVGIINEQVIDRVNVLQATYLAMHQALRHLAYQRPAALSGHLLIDGNGYRPDDGGFSYQTIVDGDANVLSIACASIIAKVVRDRLMAVYDKIYPHYGLAGHKGYPTKAHREAVQKYGSSPIHRMTFQGAMAA